MLRSYLETWYRLDGQAFGLLSIFDDVDGVVVDANGFIPCFTTRGNLLAYASANALHPVIGSDQPNTTTIDLDRLQKRLSASSGENWLNAWNLFSDVSVSVGVPFDEHQQETNRVYDKLFYGSNLPSVTPVGKSYSPLWSAEERVQLRSLMSRGLEIFRAHVRLHA